MRSRLSPGLRAIDPYTEIEVVDLREAAQPEGVDVHQRRAVDLAGVHARDDERRRGHLAAHAVRGPGEGRCEGQGRSQGEGGREEAFRQDREPRQRAA